MNSSQARILEYCLTNAIFDGWTVKLLEKACENAGLDINYWKIVFPAGCLDVVDYFINQTTEESIKITKLDGLRTHEKIRALVKCRLELYARHKQVIQSTTKLLLPHPLRNLNATYRVVDEIWRAAGDTSTDWNFYSKRTLLAGVYTTTFIYWLNDNSENHEATWEFLDKRLGNAMQVGKGIGKVKDLFKKVV